MLSMARVVLVCDPPFLSQSRLRSSAMLHDSVAGMDHKRISELYPLSESPCCSRLRHDSQLTGKHPASGPQPMREAESFCLLAPCLLPVQDAHCDWSIHGKAAGVCFGSPWSSEAEQSIEQ